jgi:hypothetical protein
MDRIIRMAVSELGGEQRVAAIRGLALQVGGIHVVRGILGEEFIPELACAAFDEGELLLFRQLTELAGERLLSDKSLLQRFRRSHKDEKWLNTVKLLDAQIAAAHPDLFIEYLKQLKGRGLVNAAAADAQLLSNAPDWHFVGLLAIAKPAEAVDLLALNKSLIERLSPQQLPYFLSGWDAAASTGSWGTLLIALESYLKRNPGERSAELRLADASYVSGKFERAAKLYEAHLAVVIRDGGRRGRLADCYRELGLVEKLRELENVSIAQ